MSWSPPSEHPGSYRQCIWMCFAGQMYSRLCWDDDVQESQDVVVVWELIIDLQVRIPDQLWSFLGDYGSDSNFQLHLPYKVVVRKKRRTMHTIWSFMEEDWYKNVGRKMGSTILTSAGRGQLARPAQGFGCCYITWGRGSISLSPG